MIESFYRVVCDDCDTPHTFEPQAGDEISSRPAGEILLAAERDGWKVYRTCFDFYYGKAWCPDCLAATVRT